MTMGELEKIVEEAKRELHLVFSHKRWITSMPPQSTDSDMII